MHTVETTDPLVESADAKPGDTKCQLYTYRKKFVYKWTHRVQICVVQESTIIYFYSFPLLGKGINKQQ